MKNKNILFLVSLLVILLTIGVYLFLTKEEDPTDNSNQTSMLVEDDDTKEMEKEEEITYVDISAEEAYQLIMDEEVIIIDVSNIYNQGHIPNAINYYVGDGSLDDAIPSLDPDEKYLVYCHVDSASILGAEKLIDAGFKNVYRLEGNYSAWVDAGYDIEK